MTNITTRSMSNYRDGANLFETKLTQDYIRKNGVKLLATRNMFGDARGSEGQPLLFSGLHMRDGRVRNVHIQCSMANYVYCWDDDTNELLWVQKLGQAVKGTKAMDMYLINDNWGILSTPVIDPNKHYLYCVAMSSPTNSLNDSKYFLHQIRLVDGSMVNAPLDLSNASYTNTNLNKSEKFSTVPRKQRCALAFANIAGSNTVIIANGSFNEDADTNMGWVICVNVDSVPEIGACWTSITKYSGAGIWMAGQGPAIDDNGFIYLMTGNGSFDGVNDFGESFCKLQYKPKQILIGGPGIPASLKIVDWFTPFTDTGRVGLDATLADTSLAPWKDQSDPTNDPTNMDSPHDQDLNSGGPLLLPKILTGYDKNVIVGAGKDGFLYVVDMDNMGKTQLADFAPDKIASNYAKLLSPVYGFSYYPAGLDLQPTDLSTLPTTYFGFTHHVHGTPVFYDSPKYGPMLFVQGENGPLRAFTFNKDYTLTYLGCSNEIASFDCRNNPPGGMPGGMLALSANANVAGTGLIHCLIPYGNANNSITQGRYIIYAADNVINGVIEKLWDSQDWGPDHQFFFNKFNIATPANGKVRFCDYSGNVLVYG